MGLSWISRKRGILERKGGGEGVDLERGGGYAPPYQQCRVQNVLWRAQNLLVISSLKNIIILCGTNNLLQESPEDIADGMVEIAQTFQSSYNLINIAIGGILMPVC